VTIAFPAPVTDPLLADLRRRAPELHALLDPARIAVGEAADGPVPADFEDAAGGGRGDSYRLAQRDPRVRLHGIRQLFTLAAPDGRLGSWRPAHVLLDVLGGDGTLARAVRGLLPADRRPTVLTSDLAGGMVAAAQRLGLPAVRQPAQALQLRDGSVDAVVLAYGTHHVPVGERAAAVAEARRVLRPGGRVVLHDFEDGSPVARWFAEVVHPLSRTGHPYPHFTEAGMRDLLTAAGLVDVTVRRVYDPFRLVGPDRVGARRLLGRHLLDMYGLDRLRADADERGADPDERGADPDERAADRVAALADDCFRYSPREAAPGQAALRLRHDPAPSGWAVELPRVALVAAGTRSATSG
jgi:SAM-dependent methyltransferase